MGYAIIQQAASDQVPEPWHTEMSSYIAVEQFRFSSTSILICLRINASTSPQEFCFPCWKHHCVFLPEPFSVKGTKVEKEESHSCSSHISIKRSLKWGFIPSN